MKTFVLILSVITVAFFPASIVRAEGGDLSDRSAQIGGTITPPALGNDPRMAAILEENPSVIEKGAVDHKARVFEFEGDVRILKAGKDEWVLAEKEMVLEPGDQILTGKDSFVDVVYDDHFLNVARIDAETKAEFRSIEPTELHLEDGKIFSALDGLAPGDGYRISTPTAVAGVRGTTFDVMHNAQTKLDIINVYPDTTPHLGEVFVEPAEGKPLSLTEGEGLSQGKVVEIPQKDLEGAQQFREAIENNFGTDRQEGFKVLQLLQGGDSTGQKEILNPEDENNKFAGGLNDGNSGDGEGFDQGVDQEGSDPFFGSAKMENPSAPDMETKIDSMLDDALTPPDDFNSKPLEGAQTQERRDEKNQKPDESQNPALKTSGEKKPDMGAMMNFLATGGVSQPGQSDSTGAKPPVDFSGMMNHLGFQPDVSEKFGSQLNDMTSRGMDMTHFIGSKDVSTAPMPLPGMPETMTAFNKMDPSVVERSFYQMMGSAGDTQTVLDPAMMKTIMQEVLYNPTETITRDVLQDYLTSNNVSLKTQESIMSFLDILRSQGHGRIYDFFSAQQPTLLSTAISNSSYVNNPVPNPIAVVSTENSSYELSIFKIVNGETLSPVNPLYGSSRAIVEYNIKENGTIVQTETAVCTASSCVKPSSTTEA
jgi:hypothetical protein